MKFEPAIDKTYKILSSIAIFILIGTIFIILISQLNVVTFLIAIIIFIFIGYFLLSIRETYYEINHEFLTANQPLFQKKIPLNAVIKITDKYSLFTTPALLKMAMASKTLTIKYRNSKRIKWLTISPIEEDIFIEEILKVNPNITVERKRNH